MNLPPFSAPPEVRLPIYRVIEASLREAIASGELPFGSRLPNVQGLASHYRASVFTIQTALGELAKEGLIERSRSRGTFVTAGSQKLHKVGLYFGGDFLHGREMAAYRDLHQKLTGALTHGGVKCRLWIDSRPKDAQHEPLPELVAAVAQREIQGLIVGSSTSHEMKWLSRLGAPLSEFGTWPVPSRVDLDRPLMVRDALADLKRQGARSVGMIFPWGTGHIFQTPPTKESVDTLEAFPNAVADMGLKTKNSWIRLSDHFMGSGDYESFGFHQFQEIWKQPERPDGLLIYPDIVARGSLTAMLHAGVSVPGDLKLVLHRNEGIPVLCPLPVSWMQTDLALVANALVSQIEKQLAGQAVEPIFIPHTLVPLGSKNPSRSTRRNPK